MMQSIHKTVRAGTIVLWLLLTVASLVNGQDTTVTRRPFVAGGIYDKPFMTRLGGKTTIGGYMDLLGSFHREAGINEGWSFDARRFNLFTYSVITDGVVVASEIEIEHGGEEFKLEYAILDVTFHDALNLRGGIILSPLSKTNLVHDSPKLEFAERPLVTTEIIPSTLSEAGVGFFGAFYPTDLARITYELYAVNGFHQDILEDAPGTRIPLGKNKLFEEDNNGEPAFVGRFAFSPSYGTDVGFSFHTGVYNVFTSEGLELDERRNLTILAFDAEHSMPWLSVQAEAAFASIDVPSSLRGLFAEKQWGYVVQANVPFARSIVSFWPRSVLTGSVRFEMVDFDQDLSGDDHTRLTLGVNFRPVQDTVIKLNYEQNWVRDRERNLTRGMRMILALSSYF